MPSGDVGYDDKEALINALNAAIAILKRNEYVGTVDQPKRWIEGRASLQHGIIGDDPMDIALFGGHVGGNHACVDWIKRKPYWCNEGLGFEPHTFALHTKHLESFA